MIKCFKFFLLTALFFAQFKVSAQCETGEDELIVVIEPDFYDLEVSWTITEYFSNEVVYFGSAVGDTLCLPINGCYFFRIFDAAGDGICCDYGDGFYQVYYNGNLIAEGGDYTSFEYAGPMGCGLGQACSSALLAQLDVPLIATSNQNWFTFTPADSGLYTITTCLPENACNTNITVYNYCNGLQYAENVQGALTFAENGCDTYAESAVLQVNFFANQEYFIKIDDFLNDCGNASINWMITYTGPLTGCTDSTACNYQPFATISDNTMCVYPGDNPLCDGPDLVVDSDVFYDTYLIAKQTVNELDCYLDEGCVSDLGERELLKFETKFYNIGSQDFYLGVPPIEQGQDDEFWDWADCHQHYHYADYAKYTLYDEAHNEIPIGYKTGFCMMDLECPFLGDYKYSCEFQGLTAGCADIYSNDLPCQWIDITDIPEGLYHFVTTVNFNFAPDALGHYEQDFSNNWGHVCFYLHRDAEGDAYIEFLDDCQAQFDCNGTIFGDAVEDCYGICNGNAILGDISNNGSFGDEDVNIYFEQIHGSTEAADNCNDLTGDGSLDFYDAIIALQCVVYDNCPEILPYEAFAGPGIAINFTDNEIVFNDNPDEVYIDVQFYVPSLNFDVIGLKFKVETPSGFSILNLVEANPNLEFVSAEGDIAWLSTETPAVLNPTDSTFILCRLFIHNAQIGDEICITDFEYAITHNNKKLLPQIGIENYCATIVDVQDTTSINTPLLDNSLSITHSNNLMNISFTNYDLQSVKVFDLSGKIIAVQKVGGGKENVQFNTNQWVNGNYLIVFSGENWLTSRKFAIVK